MRRDHNPLDNYAYATRNGREAGRLAELEYLDAVRPEVDSVLQKLADDVRIAFGVKLCMVNLILPDVQYFKVWSGDLPEELAQARQDPRERSMCQYVVESEKPLEVRDFLDTEDFREQHFYINYGIRFYAGWPLVTSNGHIIGTLCLLDTEPKSLDPVRMSMLGAFARAVVGRLEVLGALERERRAKEEEARRREETERLGRQNELLLNSAGEGIFGLDENGDTNFVNPAAARMLGYEAEHLLSHRQHATIHHSHPDGSPYPEEDCPIHATLRDGAVRSSSDEVFWREDGTCFPVEYSSRPVWENGQVSGVVITFRDVTERKRSEEALRRSEARHHAVVETAFDAIITMTADGVILSFNQGAERIFDYTPQEVIGQPLTFLIPERFREKHAAGVYRYLRTGEALIIGRRMLELPGLRRDGREVPLELSITEVREGGDLLFTGVMRDITERKRSEEVLQVSEERFRSLVQNSSDTISVLEADGTIRYQSPAAERTLGYSTEEMLGTNAFSYIHPDDAERVANIFGNRINERGVRPAVELRIRHADGSWRHMETVSNNLLGEPSVAGIVLNSRDITERKLLEERLAYQAFHDTLTGLPNQELFSDRLRQALARTDRRRGMAVAVLFLDLDNFKVVTDGLGHEVGDRLLVAVAGRLRSCLRPEDTVSRFGGDEFTILLEDGAEMGAAVRIAERVSDALGRSFKVEGYEVHVSASMGIALGKASETTAEDLMREANMAVRRAKKNGKSRHEVFDPAMNVRAQARLQLESELRRAISEEQFIVHYQPLVSLETGTIVGTEALVRWEHPVRGMVSPAEFIPLAEETGLIVPIGRWVLEEACRQVCEWHARYPANPPLVMNVNLSARQFQHPDLVEDIVEILGKNSVPPGCLELEITESAAIENLRSSIFTLENLNAAGVRLAIDDFGTGYSILDYLKRLPVDSLKIDRSFIRGLGLEAGDTAIVRTTVAFARALDLSIVAEGIETAVQCERLKEFGCNLGQGYYFARPLPASSLEDLLGNGHTHLPPRQPGQ